jgi:pectate lyase
MKFSATALLLAATAVASPTKPLAGRGLTRRQAGEACSVGYCLENGGTTGGAAGPTVTVSDLAGLTEAAESDGPLTIIVNGNISGSARIRVAADKTIFGENGACKFSSSGPA